MIFYKIIENLLFVARDSLSGKEEFYEVRQRDIIKMTPHFQQVETALVPIEDRVEFFGNLVSKNSITMLSNQNDNQHESSTTNSLDKRHNDNKHQNRKDLERQLRQIWSHCQKEKDRQ